MSPSRELREAIAVMNISPFQRLKVELLLEVHEQNRTIIRRQTQLHEALERVTKHLAQIGHPLPSQASTSETP
jgi:hypothetical protein